MSSRRSFDLSEGLATLRIEYYSDRPTHPSNLDERLPQLERYFGKSYGLASNFLRTGKAYVKASPPMPVMPADPNTLEYKIAEKAHLEKVSLVVKENQRHEENAPRIYAEMLELSSPSARAQYAKSPDWNAVSEAACDPVALLRIMNETLMTVGKTDKARARQAVARNLQEMFQGKDMPLEEFYRQYTAAVARGVLLGIPASLGEDLASDFLHKLGNRYSELKKNVANTILPTPKTMAEAYELAGSYMVVVPQRGQLDHAFASSAEEEHGRPRRRKEEGRGTNRYRSRPKSPGSSKESKSAKKPGPPGVKKEERPPRKCYICDGPDHIARYCPQRKARRDTKGHRGPRRPDRA